MRKTYLERHSPKECRSIFFLLASYFLFALGVARYDFELKINHLLNNQINTVQNLMTDLGYFHDLYFSI